MIQGLRKVNETLCLSDIVSVIFDQDADCTLPADRQHDAQKESRIARGWARREWCLCDIVLCAFETAFNTPVMTTLQHEDTVTHLDSSGHPTDG